MSAAWILNSVSLFATTVGALLIFLYLSKAPSLAGDGMSAEAKRACEKHRRLLMISVGLLAAWLLVQDLAVILL
ncbi:MAG TPA: hypothetical protein VKS43_04170 [Burkholderiales bacterium]|nr:hypothetical protein [Burkholderiales bacterium]